MKRGVREGVAMAISGHKTRSVFERYHIKDMSDCATLYNASTRTTASMHRYYTVPILLSLGRVFK